MERLTPIPTGINKDRSYLTCVFLKRSDLKRYRCILEQLQESAYFGRDEYPQTTVGVYDILIRFSGQFNSVGERYQHKPTRNQGMGGGKTWGEEVSFSKSATGGAISGTDGGYARRNYLLQLQCERKLLWKLPINKQAHQWCH